MAVSLIVAKNEKEMESIPFQSRNYLSVGIEEKEIYDLIRDIKGYLDDIDYGCADDFLYKLEIYGEEILSKDRVENYLRLSKVLLNANEPIYNTETDSQT